MSTYRFSTNEQESIPVGCVPSAAVTVGGVYLPGGVPAQGEYLPWGVYLPRGVYLPKGVYLRSGVYLPRGSVYPACTEADIFVADGNKSPDWPPNYHKTTRMFPEISRPPCPSPFNDLANS